MPLRLTLCRLGASCFARLTAICVPHSKGVRRRSTQHPLNSSTRLPYLPNQINAVGFAIPLFRTTLSFKLDPPHPSLRTSKAASDHEACANVGHQLCLLRARKNLTLRYLAIFYALLFLHWSSSTCEEEIIFTLPFSKTLFRLRRSPQGNIVRFSIPAGRTHAPTQILLHFFVMSFENAPPSLARSSRNSTRQVPHPSTGFVCLRLQGCRRSVHRRPKTKHAIRPRSRPASLPRRPNSSTIIANDAGAPNDVRLTPDLPKMEMTYQPTPHSLSDSKLMGICLAFFGRRLLQTGVRVDIKKKIWGVRMGLLSKFVKFLRGTNYSRHSFV